ncbi:class I SAM-dependent methyltransferase [Saccharibacillus sacchari]|uniref:Class I SAM-dependent methyltransferase n=1 Tax=Saccharibacillus sacchari TaxID=456493 RepID=A0ACC6PJ41_9BACL
MNTPDKKYWNTTYTELPFHVDHDGWLDKYAVWLDPQKGKIVDLGCGLGHNAKALRTQGFDVLACDLSEKALEQLRQDEPQMKTLQLDMADGLPFADGSLQAVVADLSLHYFSRSTTVRIIGDIHRALQPGGLLLCRVHAVAELAVKQGAVAVKDDPFLYESEGILRRFFDERQLRQFFPDPEWETVERNEQAMERYGQLKRFWEVGVKKL